MKKLSQFCSSLFILLISTCVISQNTITGTVTEDGVPVSGASVLVKGTNIGVQTNFDGVFSLDNVEGDAILVVSLMGFTAKEIKVDNRTNISIEMNADVEVLVSSVVSISPKNFWIGAKVGYNFIGDTGDNFFVGSASIAMNVYDGLLPSSKHHFAIVGNIGNFKFDREGANSEDLKKIAQSINGLSVGLGYTYDLYYNDFDEERDDDNYSVFRAFGLSGVRLTSFDNIGESQETVNLAQSATSVGLEWQLGGFKKKGTLSLSTGISMFLFDESIYNSIFEEEKSSLFTVDFTIILPISNQIGFFTNGTFSKDTSAAYIMGIIFKS